MADKATCWQLEQPHTNDGVHQHPLRGELSGVADSVNTCVPHKLAVPLPGLQQTEVPVFSHQTAHPRRTVCSAPDQLTGSVREGRSAVLGTRCFLLVGR